MLFMTRSSQNPWRAAAFCVGFLGVCLFLGIASRSLALDDQSSLFQGQAGKMATPGAAGAPMALPEESQTPSPSLFSTLLRLVLALAITIALVFVTIWGLKWVWEN